MATDEENRITQLVSLLRGLRPSQLEWVDKIAHILHQPMQADAHKSDLLSGNAWADFGDILRIHHAFSEEALSKDRFEHALVGVLSRNGRKASLAPRGNPGHDLTIDGVPVSLKTQANRGAESDAIWISKWMELGKGEWTNKTAQLTGLVGQFLEHMNRYDRILVLRVIGKQRPWVYELVEIPKALMLRAKTGKLEMMKQSKQMPKPGYCHVFDGRRKLFDLLF